MPQWISEEEKLLNYLDNEIFMLRYEVHTITFQTFFVWAFKIVVDSWKFSMLLLYNLWDDWPNSFSIKEPIRKKSGNLSYAPRISKEVKINLKKYEVCQNTFYPYTSIFLSQNKIVQGYYRPHSLYLSKWVFFLSFLHRKLITRVICNRLIDFYDTVT